MQKQRGSDKRDAVKGGPGGWLGGDDESQDLKGRLQICIRRRENGVESEKALLSLSVGGASALAPSRP